MSAWPVSFSVQPLHYPFRPPSSACAQSRTFSSGAGDRNPIMTVSFFQMPKSRPSSAVKNAASRPTITT